LSPLSDYTSSWEDRRESRLLFFIFLRFYCNTPFSSPKALSFFPKHLREAMPLPPLFLSPLDLFCCWAYLFSSVPFSLMTDDSFSSLGSGSSFLLEDLFDRSVSFFLSLSEASDLGQGELVFLPIPPSWGSPSVFLFFFFPL